MRENADILRGGVRFSHARWPRAGTGWRPEGPKQRTSRFLAAMRIKPVPWIRILEWRCRMDSWRQACRLGSDSTTAEMVQSFPGDAATCADSRLAGSMSARPPSSLITGSARASAQPCKATEAEGFDWP